MQSEWGPQGRSTPRAALLAFLGVETGALIVFLVLGRARWFSADEWDFLAGRSAGSVHDLFQPHNEHWSTLPVLTFRLLWTLVGVRSYVPYLALVVVLHLTVAALLWVVMRRAEIDPWIATTVAAVFALFGAGYFNIVFAFQIGFNGSLVFGLLHLIAADHDGHFDIRDGLGLACGLLSLMCSGVGVTMAIVVGLSVLLRRDWRITLLHTVPLMAAFVVWFSAIGHRSYARPSSWTETVRFAGHDLWATVKAVGQYVPVAVLLVGMFALGAWLLLRGADIASRRAARIAPVVALAAGAIVFLLITGVGRANEEVVFARLRQGPAASRYLHVVAALLLPLVGLAADAIVRRRRWAFLLVVPLLLAGVPSNVRVASDATTDMRATASSYRQLILTLPRLPVAREVPRATRPDPVFDTWMTMGWLLDGVHAGRIPGPGAVSGQEFAMISLHLALRREAEPASCLYSRAGSGVLRLRAGDELRTTSSVALRFLPGNDVTLPAVEFGRRGRTDQFRVTTPTLLLRTDDPAEEHLYTCRQARLAAARSARAHR